MRGLTVPFAMLSLAAAVLPARAQEPCSGSTADPQTFASEWLDAWNSRDVDRILTFYAEDALYEDVPVVTNGWGVPLRGHDMIREGLAEGFEAMPDLSFELVSASGAGDRMAVEWVMTGTQEGDYPGLPATGRSVSIRGLTLIELEGGKIASSRDYYDAYLFLTQLGAVPAPSPEGAREPAGSESVASMIRGVFADVWSRGDLSAVDELFAPDFVGHFPERTVHGRDGLRAAVIAHRRSFPDWTETVEESIVDRDRVVVRFTSRGTNRGEFLGNPPTGNRVEISEVVVFRLRDGRIAEQWVYPDILAMQRQLGE